MRQFTARPSIFETNDRQHYRSKQTTCWDVLSKADHQIPTVDDATEKYKATDLGEHILADDRFALFVRFIAHFIPSA